MTTDDRRRGRVLVAAMTPLRFWPFVSLIVFAMAIVAVCTVTGRMT